MNVATDRSLSRWFYFFLFFHVCLWTLIPWLVRHNLPMDAIEGAIWGHQLEWGYDKNPFMNAWLTALAIRLGNGWSPDFFIYLFSQLSVGLAFWSIWKLSKAITTPVYALIAALLLEGMQYYNLHAIDLNDNTLEVGLWAITMYVFYRACKKSTWTDWLLTGFFAALSLMTKYYSALLLISMGLFFLFNKKNIKKEMVLGSFLVFFIIILPHTVWLFSHHFVTVQYAVARISSLPNAWNHLINPIQFTWQQFEVLLPVIVLFCGVFLVGRPKRGVQENLTHFDRSFLLFIGLGPFLLTILLSVIFGITLRAAWGQPILALFPLFLLLWTKPTITSIRLYYFLIVSFSLTLILTIGYSFALIQAKESSSANYPGKYIAATLTQSWHERYHQPLAFVAGSRWLAGNIAYYSSDQPAVYIDWTTQLSPWIDEDNLNQFGALFVWDLSEDDQIPYAFIKKRFPRVGPQRLMQFTWLRNNKLEPIKMKVAYLKPLGFSNIRQN